MKHTWLTIGALAMAAAACAYLLKRRGRSGRSEGGSAGAEQELFPVIAAGICEHAGIFDGLYESLFQAAHDQALFSTEAYEEWCDRASQVESEAFRSAFAQIFSKEDLADEPLCRKKMEMLLSCIQRANIHRERESGASYPADEMMSRAYLTIDGSRMEHGAAYTVMKSAWVCGSRVVEYGVLLPAAAQNGEGACQA